MDALMYGDIPSASIAPLDSALPVIADRSPRRLLLSVAVNTSLSMPGTGSQQPIRYRNSNASVINILVRISLFLNAFINVRNIITPQPLRQVP